MLESFDILKSIGNGATSEVFQARDLKTDTIVALKRFHPVLMQDPELVERLRGEVEVLKSLRHPNVVGLRNEHFADGQYWLEIDFVDGGDLRHWLRQNPATLLEPRIFILAQIARGLGHAHEQAIVHRDLKPENILVANDGQVRITDFGLARSIEKVTVTRLGLLVGSLGYMAPEVINGHKAKLKSDLFSFGVIAYEVLTGNPPFLGESPQALIHSICEGKYRPLKELGGRVPPRLAEIIDRCLQTKPEARPASIWAVEAELMNHLLSTGNLTLCRKLMTHQESSLQEALRRKYQFIDSRLAEITELNPEIKRELMYLASEVKSLFPNDPLLKKIFALLGVQTEKRRKPIYWWAAGCLMAMILTGVAVTWRPRPAPALPPPPQGFIQVKVDDSAAVKVDGRLLNALERSHFATTPGRHKIEISKEGFQPIAGEIEVTDGQTTQVNAGAP